MKKKIALILVLCAIVALLCGCSSTSYDEAKIYDAQANTVIEQTIRDNIQTGSEKVQDHLKEEINKLIENETIKVPIRDIKFEESEEELDLVNKELEDL